MRVAVVAGPDPGHAFPAIALCLRLVDAGDEAVLITGRRWVQRARAEGLEAVELQGLAPRDDDDDADAGQRLHARGAHIATALLPDLRAIGPDLVVSDVLTSGGALAAELAGIRWVELSPHPLYLPSRGLPPIGSGLAPGEGFGGRIRDVIMRAATARSVRQGERERREARVGIGLPARSPEPAARLIATIPALEVPRPDWPDRAHLIGPLLWDPADGELAPPPGDGPLVMVAPSTAATGELGMVDAALEALAPDRVGQRSVRMVVSTLHDGPADLPAWVRAGRGRQDAMLAQAAVAVCGGGHGMLAKALSAGVPCVVVPGGGDQWELANRAARQGSALIVRPLTAQSLGDAVRRVLTEPSFADAARAAAATARDVVDPVQVCRAAAGAATVG
ncbi:glycosyltransferase [Speluncibacter jeojiensis]|uniref:Glycosyl transferase n=1 Tax=Speluncibacter jeojiensis TaxID=2710754 RepID=A0A9X4RCE5_9ACTN|nr:glycosyl transferase [Corynebacteriales bacterium D3-21]